MNNTIRSLCVFCGSSFGARSEYTEEAGRLGRLLAEKEITLIYGGARVGLMGKLADSCLAVEGRVTGIIPEKLMSREIAHPDCTELIRVEGMLERKEKMIALSDAFIVLPGGIGTMDETYEVMTWQQLGLTHSPLGLLNISGYFNPFLKWMETMVSEGFLQAGYLDHLPVSKDSADLLERLHSLYHGRERE